MALSRYLLAFFVSCSIHTVLLALWHKADPPQKTELDQTPIELIDITEEIPPRAPTPLPPPPAPPAPDPFDVVEEEWDVPPPEEEPPPDAPKPTKAVSHKSHANYDPHGIDTIFSKDQKPQPISIWGPRHDKLGNRIPRYPEEARRAEQEAHGVFNVLVDTNGYVLKIVDIKREGYPPLLELAKEYMRDWKFPVKQDEFGYKLRYWTRKEIEYSVSKYRTHEGS